MINILPTVYPPIINCYGGNAAYCSILQVHKGYHLLILINNLMIMKKSNSVLSFCRCEQDNSYENKKTISSSNNSLWDIIVEEVDNNSYLFLLLDHFYLPDSDAYLHRNMLHGYTLLYGYNQENQSVFIADNFQNGKYTQCELQFSDLLQARSFIGNERTTIRQKQIIAYSCNPDYKYSLSEEKLLNLLEDYLSGGQENCSQMFPNFQTLNALGIQANRSYKIEDYLYGIKVYEWLFQEIKKCEEMDIRLFSFLENHRHIIYLLCEHLFPLDADIMKQSIELYNSSKITIGVANKFNITKNNTIRSRVIEYELANYEKEKLLLEQIREKLLKSI